ncbi:hypothetical protein QUC31_011064 [Theobroma cacao]
MFAKAFPYSFVHYRWAAGFGVNNVIAGIRVLFAQNLTVICPGCGKDLIVRHVASTVMPQIYQNKMVWILCNDCGENSEVNFHIVAHKCLKCNSYNTRQTRGGAASCSSEIAEIVR